jgi:hypothetical protein
MDTHATRVPAIAGITGALITFAFGILHPKGTSNLGSLTEWMTRVGASDVWVLVHFMLLVASILVLVALVGIASSYTEEPAATWAHLGMVIAIVATVVAVITFLIDGAVVKETADRWLGDRQDPALTGAARLATDTGFMLVAGLQLTTGAAALLFAIAGLRAAVFPRYLAWLALVAGLVGIIPGAAHYLAGTSAWTANASYLSNGLFAIWILVMSRRLLAMGSLRRDGPIADESRFA